LADSRMYENKTAGKQAAFTTYVSTGVNLTKNTGQSLAG